MKCTKAWTSEIRMKISMAETTFVGSLEVNLPETSKTKVRYVSIQMSVYVEVGRW